MAARLLIAISAAACAVPAVLAAPCDIYAASGTPCVAAHSITRALFSAYAGPLYQLNLSATGATQDIHPLAPGGFADAAAQDAFCAAALSSAAAALPPLGSVVAPVSPPTAAASRPGNGVTLVMPFLQPVVASVAASARTSGRTRRFSFIIFVC